MKFNKSNRAVMYLLYVIGFLVVINLIGGFLVYSFSDVTKVEIEEPVERVVFVLSDEQQVYFTETLIYYPEFKRGFVIDVPGNIGAIYKSLDRVDRIDAVYKEKGIATYRDEVADILGITATENTVDYIEISVTNFKELVDLLGGLKLFIPAQVDIKSPQGERWLLPSGAVTLDGDKAYTYLSYQDQEEKYESFEERRRNVFVALLASLTKNAEYMSDTSRFEIYGKRMVSNLGFSDMQKLIVQIANGEFEGLKLMPINGQKRRVDGVEGVLLFPEFDGRDIKRVVQLKTNTLISTKGGDVSRIYVLEIQNGTSIQGLAYNTHIFFKGAGYDVLNYKNADREYDKTVIINHIGEEEIAKSLGDYIHCTNIIEDEISEGSEIESKQKDVDFTIILGKDFDGRFVR